MDDFDQLDPFVDDDDTLPVSDVTDDEITDPDLSLDNPAVRKQLGEDELTDELDDPEYFGIGDDL